jgi:hypothetical protein
MLTWLVSSRQIRKRVDALIELDYASEESPGGVVHYVP